LAVGGEHLVFALHHDVERSAAFEQAVPPHADRLFRLAMWFERNRVGAEDVVEQTMMQALHSFHDFQSGTNRRVWLVSILQRIVSERRSVTLRSPLIGDHDERTMDAFDFRRQFLRG
jgi:DNA-directed RNA polymerase specialized sigma24 family protein